MAHDPTPPLPDDTELVTFWGRQVRVLVIDGTLWVVNPDCLPAPPDDSQEAR